jgi:hypothetical protein
MPIPTWSVGQVLSASDVDSWFVPVAVIKPSDTGRSNTTSMTNDPALQLTLAAGATYEIRGVIFYDGPSAASSDIQWTFTLPTGASGKYWNSREAVGGSTLAGAYAWFWSDTVTANTTGVSTTMTLPFEGILAMGATAGTMHFLWAQRVSNATNTHVQNNSFLLARRIG